MNPKSVVTGVLLLFVGASVGMLVAMSMRTPPDAAPSVAAMPGTTIGVEPVPPAQPTISDGVIAYYFHGNTRCVTCNKIEAYAADSVEANFADLIQEGSVEWRVVNFELPANEHLAKEYELIASSVVLVRMQDGSQAEWKNLDQVWKLVGDREMFMKYVEDETRQLLENAG